MRNIKANGDGTFTDLDHNLQWTASAWNGRGFGGNPKKINWQTAAKLFGKGTEVEGVEENGIIKGILPADKMEASAKAKGYTEGAEHIYFAGYNNWRLPTCIEVHELFENTEHGDIAKHYFDRNLISFFFWTANERMYSFNLGLFAKILNKLFANTKDGQNNYTVAWKFDLHYGSVSDEGSYVDYKNGHYIILVRDI